MLIVLGIISIVFITERSFLSGIRKGGSYLLETAREDAERMREYRESLMDEDEEDEYEFDEYEEKKHQRAAQRKRQEEIKLLRIFHQSAEWIRRRAVLSPVNQ